MSIAGAAAALSRPFTFQEVVYQLKPLTYNTCAALSMHLVERERNAMRLAVMDGIDAQEALRAHLANVATGMYEPGGQAFANFVNGIGFRKMLELCLEAPAGPDGKKPDLMRLSFEIVADKEAAEEAQSIMGALNSDPLARRQRTIPTL